MNSERKQRIKEILKKEFSPSLISIIDNSQKHEGHKGFDSKLKETHLYIKMRAKIFKNKKKKEMHQKVYSALKHEFSNGLHALELDLDEN